VLSAVSDLKLHGYLVLDDYQPNGYVSINRERRKKILQIIDADISLHKSDTPFVKDKNSIPIQRERSPHQITARYEISPGIRAIAISSLLIVGLVSAIEISIPTTTSPDSEFVAYPEYTAHEEWSSAHGADGHEGDKISSTRYPPVWASFVALKDCNDEPLQQKQT
jgi:hypothetical protein